MVEGALTLEVAGDGEGTVAGWLAGSGDGHRLQDVAGRIVDLPVNTVKSHLHRAIVALRKKREKQS